MELKLSKWNSPIYSIAYEKGEELCGIYSILLQMRCFLQKR